MKPFVKVTWHDAEDMGGSSWNSQEEIDAFGSNLCEAFSYGYLVKKTKNYLTLAADHIPPDTYGRIIKIPKRMVVKVEAMNLPETPKADPD